MSDIRRNRKPPSIARWLLEKILPVSSREFVLGDLEEEFQRLSNTEVGVSGAQRWYWRRTLQCLFQKRQPKHIRQDKYEKGDGWMKQLWKDSKFGLRVLLQKPGFFIAAVLSLALGIGANTAIFSAVNSVLIHALPFSDANRIVTVWENNHKDGIERDDVSPANFLDWKERQQVFEQLATNNPYSLDYTGGSEPETWQSALVSEGFFEILGVRALYGRTFLKEEYQEGRNHVLVLTYAFWQRKFGGDPSVIGRTLTFNDQRATIVGIMPQDFPLYLHQPEKEILQPEVIDDSWKNHRRATFLKVIAKLKPGVTIDQAQSAMNTIARQLAEEYPQTNTGIGVKLVSMQEYLTGKIRLVLLVLMGAVAMVLLIGCVNLMNLQLARGTQRQREFAIRFSLGASRAQVVRQLFMENLILAFLGCGAGILVANWTLRLILKFGPQNIPRLENMKLDPLVLIFAIAVSFCTALIFGLLPALYVSRFDTQRFLKEGSSTIRGDARQRLRNALVISQVAFAVILLVGAGLLSRSLFQLLKVNPGFTKQGVLVMQVFLYDRYDTPEARYNFTRTALSRFQSFPGVVKASMTTALPFFDSSFDSSYPVSVVGQPMSPGQEPTAFLTIAAEDYFSLLGIPLQRGRLFEPRDHEDGPTVTIINDAMARRLKIDGDPIGKKIHVQLRQNPATMEIIGVVGSMRHKALNQEELRPEFFVPYGKSKPGNVIFVIRTASDPKAMISPLKSVIWQMDSLLPFYDVATLEQLVDHSVQERRFQMMLLTVFAGIALLLCAIGIYGLISFLTAQKTNEIGLRLALGAQTHQILKMIAGHGLVLTLAGICIGVIGAMLLSRYLKSQLFEVQMLDSVTYLLVCVILLVVAAIACLVPARRATRINPNQALHYE